MEVTETHCHGCRRLCWSDRLTETPRYGALCELCVAVLVTERTFVAA